MADFTPKEKATGIYAPTGQEVKFNIEWAGHKFTDEEVEKLFNGESITITVEGKFGPYEKTGKLGKGEYNGYEFWGFQPESDRYEGEFVPEHRHVSFKRTWSSHRFTDEECEQLLEGQDLEVTGTSKKTGKEFTAEGGLDQGDYGFGFQVKRFI